MIEPATEGRNERVGAAAGKRVVRAARAMERQERG